MIIDMHVYKPEQLGLDWPLVPAINVGGCSEYPFYQWTLNGIEINGHAHSPPYGFKNYNHICLQSYDQLIEEMLYHEYGHVLAAINTDGEFGHGEYWRFIVANILNKPKIVEDYLNSEYRKYLLGTITKDQ